MNRRTLKWGLGPESFGPLDSWRRRRHSLGVCRRHPCGRTLRELESLGLSSGFDPELCRGVEGFGSLAKDACLTGPPSGETLIPRQRSGTEQAGLPAERQARSLRSISGRHMLLIVRTPIVVPKSFYSGPVWGR